MVCCGFVRAALLAIALADAKKPLKWRPEVVMPHRDWCAMCSVHGVHADVREHEHVQVHVLAHLHVHVHAHVPVRAHVACALVCACACA
jgi:hypothetical protein